MELFDLLIWTPAAAALTILTCGTPYIQAGPMYSGFDLTGRLPPIRCGYVGWQGHRDVRLDDARDCPLIMFLPLRIEKEPPVQVIHQATERNERRQEQPMPYGPGGPEHPLEFSR